MSASTSPVGSPLRVMGTPIVLERSKKRKSKTARKPRLKDADRAERNVHKAVKRTNKAFDRGRKRYEKARRASARRERDGAVIDVLPNMARGMTTVAGRLAPVPWDLLRAGSTRSIRRLSRRSVRATAWLLDRS